MMVEIIQHILLGTSQVRLHPTLQRTQQTLNTTLVVHLSVIALIRISVTAVMNRHLQPILVSVTNVINLLASKSRNSSTLSYCSLLTSVVSDGSNYSHMSDSSVTLNQANYSSPCLTGLDNENTSNIDCESCESEPDSGKITCDSVSTSKEDEKDT